MVLNVLLVRVTANMRVQEIGDKNIDTPATSSLLKKKDRKKRRPMDCEDI
jgi:hypothetical protein